MDSHKVQNVNNIAVITVSWITIDILKNQSLCHNIIFGIVNNTVSSVFLNE